MEQRRLGRTEHRSSVAVLGAAAFWGCTPEEAEAGFHLALSPRGQPPRHRAVLRSRGGRRRPARARRPRPAVRGRQERSLQPGWRPGPPGAHLGATGLRPPRPVPAPRRHQPRGAGAAVGRGRGHPRRSRRRPDPLRRHHGPRSRHAAGAAGGAAPLRPRHGHVPGLPAGVGRSRLPGRCGGAPGRVRPPRCRRHGHQGRRPAALGRGRAHRDDMVRAPHGRRARSPAASPSRSRPRESMPSAHPATSACCRRCSTPRRSTGRSTSRHGMRRWPRPWSTRSSSPWWRRPAGADGRRGFEQVRPRWRRPRLGPRCRPMPTGPG